MHMRVINVIVMNEGIDLMRWYIFLVRLIILDLNAVLLGLYVMFRENGIVVDGHTNTTDTIKSYWIKFY